MSEWKEYILEDVIEKFIDYRGKTPKKTSSGIPLMTAKIIKGGRLLEPTEYIAKEDYLDWMTRGFPEINDVLLTTEAPLGEVALVKDKNVALGQRIITLQTRKDLCDSVYLKYYLQSFEGQATLQSRASGSTVEGIKSAELKKIEISLPPLNEQRTIALILFNLDNKIDLLHSQNTTLEKMAETLFRQWFVEEAKEEWEVKPLGSLVTVKRGGSPRPIQDYLSNTGFRWLKISDATKENSPYVFEIKEHIKVEGLKKTTHLKAGTLVLSNSATPGIPKILQVDTCIHDGWLHFPKSHFSNEFLYLLFKKIRPELLQQGNGSIFTNLKTDILKEYPIPIADNESLLFFDNQVKPIFNKILKNQTQIRTLTALRDTLLPKLMSGEVTVEC